jgi:transposase InsO family protein
VSRFRFISKHRAEFGIKRLCRVLQVSRSGLYAWLAGADRRAARATTDAQLQEQIRTIHRQTRGTYGSPRVTVELRAQGVAVNHKRVERLMRVGGIVGVHLRRRRTTTLPDPAATTIPDLLGRDFTATTADQRWVGDITYLRAGSSWLYIATVVDLYSRRLVGWSLADHLRTELVVDALTAAVATRGGTGSVDGVVFHSDHGTQYTSSSFAEVCTTHQIVQSMGTIGDSYDNAVAESFFATLKRELGRRFDSPDQARLAVFSWIAFYNHRRRHSTLDYHSPIEYEKISAHRQPAAA